MTGTGDKVGMAPIDDVAPSVDTLRRDLFWAYRIARGVDAKPDGQLAYKVRWILFFSFFRGSGMQYIEMWGPHGQTPNNPLG
jgi:hypothetical protein